MDQPPDPAATAGGHEQDQILVQSTVASSSKPISLKSTNPEIIARKRRALEAQEKYGRGDRVTLKKLKDKKYKALSARLENKYKSATLKARDAEILLENESGLLEPENDLEKTYRVRQDTVRDGLDIQTARKGFELKLNDLGPYTADYTRNGRELLLAGRKGHVATIDWRDGKLGCEIQLGETVRDAKWLHNNQTFAVAQKKYVYIYDRQGVEIHKLQKHIEVTHMEFLPYHFLLATIGNAGYLKYLDTSTGQMVIEMPTKQGAPTAFRQNPYNAIIHTGHQNGTIGLWSPNATTPLVKLLAHRGPVRSLAMDREGRYMISTGQDQKMAVWDIRMFKEVNNYYLHRPGVTIDISDRGLTAVGWGTQVSIWKGLFNKAAENQEKVHRPYMALPGEGNQIERLRWCPLEDVLGVAHTEGFSSNIIPGAGEPNFDALEINPYENAKQRQESEVKGLLSKLQPEMISLNPDFVGSLDLASDAIKRKEKDLDKEPDDPLSTMRNRQRGKNSSLKNYLRKKGGKNIIDDKRVRVEEMIREERERRKARLQDQKQDYGPALARFAGRRG